MKTELKVIWVVIPILLIMSMLFLFLLNFNKPNHQLTDGFYVTIKGSVTLPNYVDKTIKPTIVQVYHSYFDTQWLCRTKNIQLANISWNNKGNKGNYSITFWLPVEEEVIVAPSCYSCSYQKTFVSKTQNLKEVNLNFDVNSCAKLQKIYEDGKQALNDASNMLESYSNVLDQQDFDKKDKQSIKDYIISGRNEVLAGNQAIDKNESLFHGTYAILYGLKASNKIQISNLKLCVKNIEKILGNHTANCYIPSYEGYTSYLASNSSLNYDIFAYLDQFRYDSYKDIDKVRDNINSIQENEERVGQVVYQCQDALRLLTSSFEHQESYCQRRKLSLNFVNFSLIALFLAIGFAIGKYGERW